MLEFKDLASGMRVSGTVDVSGFSYETLKVPAVGAIVHVDGEEAWICTDNEDLNGYMSPDMHGRSQSWQIAADGEMWPSIDLERSTIVVGTRMIFTCEVCGGRKVSIRGKHPGDAERIVCPTCLQEMFEDMVETHMEEEEG